MFFVEGSLGGAGALDRWGAAGGAGRRWLLEGGDRGDDHGALLGEGSEFVGLVVGPLDRCHGREANPGPDGPDQTVPSKPPRNPAIRCGSSPAGREVFGQ